MSSVPVRATHYMTFPYTTAGVGFSSWITTLSKNGEVVQDTPLDFREYPSAVYTFSFVNDGDVDAVWTLIIHKSGDTDNYFGESWRTTSKVIEQTVKQIRSRFDSDGGFFQSQEVK